MHACAFHFSQDGARGEKVGKKRKSGAGGLPSFLSAGVGDDDDDLPEGWKNNVKKKRREPSAEAPGVGTARSGQGRKGSAGVGSKYIELLKAKDLRVGMKLVGCIVDIVRRDRSGAAAAGSGALGEGIVVSLPYGLRGFVPMHELSDEFAIKEDAKGKDAKQSFVVDDGDDLRYEDDSSDGEDDEEHHADHAGHALDVFRLDQIVGCVILANNTKASDVKDSKSKIVLSLKLSRLQSGMKFDTIRVGTSLRCAVSSVEDHGYLVSTGIPNVNGFVKFEECEGDGGRGQAGERAPLGRGSILDVVVSSTHKKSRTLGLISKKEKTISNVLSDTAGISFNVLQPGWLVTCKVTEVAIDGLIVRFLQYFSATIDHYHLSLPLPPTNSMGELYNVGEKLRARVLFVDAGDGVGAGRIGLSLQRHLLLMDVSGAPSPSIQGAGGPNRGHLFNKIAYGEVVHNATVVRCDPKIGLLLEVPTATTDEARADEDDDSEAEGNAAAFVHISNLSDSRIDKVEKAFKPGQQIPLRVIGHRPMDGLNVATARKSILSLPFLSDRDARVGTLVEGCSVLSVHEWGLLVLIGGGLGSEGGSSGGIKAMVPATHITDSGSRKALKKIKIGTKMQCRVLQVDSGKTATNNPLSSKRKIVLTHKRSLVHNEELPLLLDYGAAAPGDVYHGFVSSIKGYGMLVRFFGKVLGLVHKSELSVVADGDTEEAVIEKLSAVYSVGQIIRVVVRSVTSANSKRKKRMLLGLLDGNNRSENASYSDVLKSDLPGVGSIIEEAKVVALLDGGTDEKAGTTQSGSKRAVVEFALGGKSSSTITGIIDMCQLSDAEDLTEPEFNCLEIGDNLGPLVVLRHHYSRSKSTPAADADNSEDHKYEFLNGWSCHLSCKGAIIDACRRGIGGGFGSVPASVASMSPGDIIAGYVASISTYGLHIRCLDATTGLAHRTQIFTTESITDRDDDQSRQSKIMASYKKGQTIFAKVIKVEKDQQDQARGKFSLTLKNVVQHEGSDVEKDEDSPGMSAMKRKYLESRVLKMDKILSSLGAQKARIGTCCECTVSSPLTGIAKTAFECSVTQTHTHTHKQTNLTFE